MVFQPKRSYSWGEGYAPNMDANIVGGVCEQIENNNGGVTKESFLEASRPEDSPTHELFEWNDTRAAELYRLDTSKRIIGCLRVTYINPKEEECNVRAFVNVSDYSEKPQYESVDVILKEEDKRAVYLKRIKQELDNYIRRNAHIEELADILIEAGQRLKNK
jgi:hypothetical protein